MSLCLLVCNFAFVQFVSAADLTADRKIQIAETCPAAQSTLQRISSSDTTARINRGRDYDQVLKLLHAMNTRVASNNIAEPKLAQLTKNFEETLNNFRNNYNRLNDYMKSTYEIDCKNHTNTFYDNLVKTREGRATVNADITKLDSIINDYQNTVRELVK
jgi:hypothetical protein